MTGAPLIDTHAHLDFVDYDDDRQQVMARARSAGLVAVVSVGIEPQLWQTTLNIAAQFEEVYPALGIHPNSAGQTNGETLADLASLCVAPGSKRVVAIGETGLDYYRDYVPHETQKESF